MSENELENPGRDESDPGQTSNEQFAAQVAPPSGGKPPVWMWFGIGGLFIVALLVIFVLPAVVTEYELPLERRAEVTTASASSAAEPAEAISPFEEAQRARQRKQAQDILAELLEHQNELESLEVASWADAPYQAALEQASIGDDYYRTQDFVLAAQSYTRARDELGALLTTIPEVLTRTLEAGEQAIAAGDAALAEDKFSLARLLDPQNQAAQLGLERARSLDEVLALFEEADVLLADGELEQAQDLYRRILDLDSHNERARAQIDAVAVRIREQEFGRVMSEGYALLEQGEPEAAIAAFQRAANLGINADQATAAIEQTENEVANARITQLRARLATAEAAEEWQNAVDLYTQVLAIDPNLSFAVEGLDYAQKRARLNALLENAIANPERFADEEVFQETMDVYYTGRGLENPGPRLQSQLDELQSLLEISQVPIEVAFVSDNLTEVTLLRESKLGLFEQQTLELTPGRYVAVGTRSGYREVRKEFVVGFGQTPETVVVQCEERVVATNR